MNTSLKITIQMLFVILFSTSVNAQSGFFDSKLRDELSQYLQKDGATQNKIYDKNNMIIWNLLTRKNIDTYNDTADIGIFSFASVGPHQHKYILLKSFHEYEILKLSDIYNARNFSDIITDLLHYFDQHANIDRRLLPLYTEAIYDSYIYNTRQYTLGEWADWYNYQVSKYTNNK